MFTNFLWLHNSYILLDTLKVNLVIWLKKPNGRELKALLALSIVVPIGLLTTFRLTGILQEPLKISETVTVDTVFLNMSRPSYFCNVGGNITNWYVDSMFSGSFTVHFLSYWENSGMLDYNDGLWLKLTAKANTTVGFIYSMKIKSSQTDEYAILDFINDDDYKELSNLFQKNLSDGSHLCGALFETVGVNQPKESELKLKPLWEFFDLNDVNHWIIVTLEIIYFNGSIYRQINIPIRLGVTLP